MYRFYDVSKSDDSEDESFPPLGVFPPPLGVVHPPSISEIQLAEEEARLDKAEKAILVEHLNKELWKAVNRKDYEEIKNLISRGADVNAKYNKYTDGSMLFSTIIHGGEQELKIVKLLIDAGADINEKNYGTSLLHWTSRSGNIEVVKLLLSKGADVNVVNNNGQTAYDVATPEIKAIIMEHEKQKWNTLLEQNSFPELNYRDEEIRDEYNKFKVSGVNQLLKNKFIYMHDNDEFDFSQALLEQFNGEGKKRRKTVRKHKKRKSRRGRKSRK
jgi:hypothetical protein